MSADALITLFGDSHSTQEVSISKGGDRFERGSKDRVKVELDDVGTPNKLRISHNRRGNQLDWFLEQVDVINLRANEMVRFPCGEWVSERKGKMSYDLVPDRGRSRLPSNSSSPRLELPSRETRPMSPLARERPSSPSTSELLSPRNGGLLQRTGQTSTGLLRRTTTPSVAGSTTGRLGSVYNRSGSQDF